MNKQNNTNKNRINDINEEEEEEKKITKMIHVRALVQQSRLTCDSVDKL